ncbi:MAG: hypothetical protein WC444_03305 [Candidatus Paceibacterota bacterium]
MNLFLFLFGGEITRVQFVKRIAGIVFLYGYVILFLTQIFWGKPSDVENSLEVLFALVAGFFLLQTTVLRVRNMGQSLFTGIILFSLQAPVLIFYYRLVNYFPVAFSAFLLSFLYCTLVPSKKTEEVVVES